MRRITKQRMERHVTSIIVQRVASSSFLRSLSPAPFLPFPSSPSLHSPSLPLFCSRIACRPTRDSDDDSSSGCSCVSMMVIRLASARVIKLKSSLDCLGQRERKREQRVCGSCLCLSSCCSARERKVARITSLSPSLPLLLSHISGRHV